MNENTPPPSLQDQFAVSSKGARVLEMTIDTEETFVRKSDKSTPNWCVACGMEIEMVAPEVAAVVTDLSARDIYRLVESNQVHFTETAEGLLFVCCWSLSFATQGRGTQQCSQPQL